MHMFIDIASRDKKTDWEGDLNVDLWFPNPPAAVLIYPLAFFLSLQVSFSLLLFLGGSFADLSITGTRKRTKGRGLRCFESTVSIFF